MARESKDLGIGYKTRENAKSIINDDGSGNVIQINRKININDLHVFLVSIFLTDILF